MSVHLFSVPSAREDHPAGRMSPGPASGRSGRAGSGVAAAAGSGPAGSRRGGARGSDLDRLTHPEERAGLRGDPAMIGTRAGWADRLRERGYALRGHRLVRSRAEDRAERPTTDRADNTDREMDPAPAPT